VRRPARRHLSALFALLYLLLAGMEELQHAWAEPAGLPEAHVHAENDPDHCPPPLHDELHCPTCKLLGAPTLPASADPRPAPVDAAPARFASREDASPSLRSHAPPTSRAPPLG
jgi:hypothetical protein